MDNLKGQYIRFAIKNWLIEWMLWEPYEKLIDLDVWEHQVYFHWRIKNWYTFTDTFDIIRLITSKEFIEAIADFIVKRQCEWMTQEHIDKYSDNWTIKEKQRITIQQALAIRDNKLEEFYRNILNIKD